MSATGADHLSYQWKKDGENITNPKCFGTDTPMLSITEFVKEDEGEYSCLIKNSQSSIESEKANLALGK